MQDFTGIRAMDAEMIIKVVLHIVGSFSFLVGPVLSWMGNTMAEEEVEVNKRKAIALCSAVCKCFIVCLFSRS